MNNSGSVKCPMCSSLIKLSSLKTKTADNGKVAFCPYCKRKILIKEKKEVVRKKACIKRIVSVL